MIGIAKSTKANHAEEPLPGRAIRLIRPDWNMLGARRYLAAENAPAKSFTRSMALPRVAQLPFGSIQSFVISLIWRHGSRGALFRASSSGRSSTHWARFTLKARRSLKRPVGYGTLKRQIDSYNWHCSILTSSHSRNSSSGRHFSQASFSAPPTATANGT
jgi:hypothetical protein